MAEALAGGDGGILWLAELIREPKTREPIEYHLITLGLRLRQLGTPALTWRDLLVIVRQCELGTPIHQAMYPEWAPWSSWGDVLTGHLLNTIGGIAWRMDGRRGKYEPLVKLPGQQSESIETEVIDGDAMPSLEAAREWAAAQMGTSSQ